MELTLTDVERWLAEDIGEGDVTTDALVGDEVTCEALVVLKEPGVVCGLEVAGAVFEALGARLEPLVDDGQAMTPGPVARVEGPARSVLTAERTALNLLARLSGIATLTRRYVDAVAGTGVDILDTRKTTPGLRALEKYAVRCGGGVNHRFGLDDAVLIKDNHIRVAGGVRAAVERVRSSGTPLPVEVEAETLDDVREAHEAGADTILLDNMDPATLREAVAIARGARLEASGGVTLETVREIAETGVDVISIGALTHSAKALDVSMEVL
jgi:nicotinate-nucleotide pyrophosphorylase (carboxylating)